MKFENIRKSWFYNVRGDILSGITVALSLIPDDHDEVIIDFKNAHVWDYSAANAISKVKQKYTNLGKKVSFVGLNKESNFVVHRADKELLDY